MQNFFGKLLDVLRQDDRFFSTDGKPLRNKIREAANNMDEKLLSLLLGDDETAKRFFRDAAGIKVFDKTEFGYVISNRELLPDSYTRYANKIALGFENGDLLSASGKVVVDFPYKDCLLEGEQTADAPKRDEIFFNQTLAPDQIDRLFHPKIFTNALRFFSDSAQVAEDFRADDNLLIKGNNLLALASLEKIFRNKVKCIYIDPPYNTGNDSFGYNDRFNHSTWLTFMKNRLDLARKLLRKDGSIWISIDDDEQAYLKVLCDEIFGRDNFVCNVVWEKVYTTKNDARWLSDSHDFILVYAKDKNIWRPNLLPRTEEMNARYSNPDNDPRGVWKSNPLQAKSGNDSSFEHTFSNGVKWSPPPGRFAAFSHETLERLERDNRIYFGEDGKGVPRVKKFLSEVKQGAVTGTIFYRDEVGDNHEAKNEMRALDLIFATPKPERLLERILTLATAAGDLVLDYHAGSGTTLAVAHKMGRRYIGVEQMDYIETLTAERLRKVLGGEQGGISARTGWKGGGSFVYCELAKQNQAFVEEIKAAKDFSELTEIYRRIIAAGFISHKVNPAQIEATWEEFAALKFSEQKRLLLELLDKNFLYVNLCDLDDEEFAIADADKKFTRSFYFNAAKTIPPTATAIAPKPTTAAIAMF